MKTILLLIAIVFTCSIPAAADSGATEIDAIALFNGKAMISVNGSKAKIISTGDSYQGVKLLSSNTDEAVVQVGDRKQTLTLDGGVILSSSLASPAASAANEAQIWADASGGFRSVGAINGQRVEFVVDTGANMVVISGELANRMNLDYTSGNRSIAATAQGTTEIYLTVLDRVSFEGLEFYNIQAGVIPGTYPQTPLLGTSYLNNVDMDRVGNKMTLRKRY